MTQAAFDSVDHETLPEALPGFEKINRFYVRKRGELIAKILPGEYYVTSNEEIISTVLGSCVSVCIRDSSRGIGGMNHFMLPEKKRIPGEHWDFHSSDVATRYGAYAMEHMINDIIKFGGNRKNFEIKICGGSRIIHTMTDVGAKNIIFIKDYLKTEGYSVTNEDVGGLHPRKVRYSPQTGRLQIRKLGSLHNHTVFDRELQYKTVINNDDMAGKVELF